LQNPPAPVIYFVHKHYLNKVIAKSKA